MSNPNPNPKYENVHAPMWAPHVLGSFETRSVDADGLPEEKRIHAVCTVCGAEFNRTCSSGLYRMWINKFASVHIHRGPFDAVPTPEGQQR